MQTYVLAMEAGRIFCHNRMQSSHWMHCTSVDGVNKLKKESSVDRVNKQESRRVMEGVRDGFKVF